MSETHEIRSLAIIPKTLVECTDLANQLATSDLLPKALRGKVPDVLMTILAGQEMGFAPMAALRSIHVIEGKPVVSADGMVALVLGSGKAVYFDRVEESDTAVTYETLRVGSKTPRRCTWTIEMARRASLDQKQNWRGYPRAMLASRAKAELARDVYPDVIAGCYTDEEIESVDRPTPPAMTRPNAPDLGDAVDAEIVTPIDAIAAAADVGALRALVPMLASLPKGADRDRAREAYGAKMRDFEAALAPATAAAVNAVTEPAA